MTSPEHILLSCNKLTDIICQTVADVIVKGVETIVKTGEKIVEKVIQAGKEIGKLIQDPLGYEWSLGNSFSRSFEIGRASCRERVFVSV